MSQIGSVPLQTLRFNNQTIAASLNGTAPSTIIGTISAAYARGWEVFNCTLRNIELVIGVDSTAVSGIFIPGTASSVGLGMGVRAPVALSGPLVLRARTTENTPITISSTTPLYINLWA